LINYILQINHASSESTVLNCDILISQNCCGRRSKCQLLIRKRPNWWYKFVCCMHG